MAHEETVFQLMQQLVIADTKTISQIMASRKIWTAGTSAYQNSYKALTSLTSLNKLVKGSDHWKIPGCKSEYQDHAKTLSHVFAELLKLPFQIKLIREHYTPINLRSDGIVMIQDGNRARVCILEIAISEKECFSLQKKNAWEQWPGACQYLAELFKVKKIPYFDFVSSRPLKGAIVFQDYLTTLRQEESL
jgi:hypothetical protein